MKRLLFSMLFAAIFFDASAYDFSAVSPSGHTLYYNIADGHAEVVRPGTGSNYNNYVTGDLIIPASVTHNGTNYDVTALTKVSIYGAFEGCSGLTSVTIPSSVTSIGSYAFSGCSGLTTTVYTGTIAQWCGISFSGSSSNPLYYSHSLTIDGAVISNLVIPDGVTSIGNYAFSGYSSLISVTIPSSVTSIGYSAFENCSGLTSVTIPSGIISIGGYAFSGCSGLTSVTIPSSVTSIGYSAFKNCSGLTSVTIPSSVTSIGSSAFSGCNGLTVMYMKPSTPPDLSNISGICDSIIDLVVPHRSYNAYLNAGTFFTRHHIYRDSVFIKANVNDTARGFIEWNDSVYIYPSSYPDSVTLTATPYYGYRFIRWSDNNTDNPRTVVTTCDTLFTAIFDFAQFNITTSVDTSIHGTVNGGGYYNYLSVRTISVWEAHGYHFTHWQDGDTSYPQRTFVLTQDTSFVAYYDKNTYTLTFQSSDTNKGIVSTASVTGEYLDTTMLIYATAKPHYHFDSWDDNDSWYHYTENPRSFVFDNNRTYTASFSIDVHNISVQVDDIAHGTVEGSGSREYGQPITVSATPYSGYQFAHWSDGSTYNPYTFAVLEDKDLTAVFIADGEPWQDTVVVYDTTYIDVPVHDTTYINVPVHDTTYIDVPVHDTTYIDVPVHDTTYIDVPVHDTTYITVTDTLTVTQYDTVTNTVYDTVDNYVYDTVTVTDTLWLTQIDTVWMHDTVIVHDTVYITSEGIGDVDAMTAKVYASNGHVVVEGANGNMVTFYDVHGRVLATKRDEFSPLRFDAPASGTYLIKIGNYPARRVVVIR